MAAKTELTASTRRSTSNITRDTIIPNTCFDSSLPPSAVLVVVWPSTSVVEVAGDVVRSSCLVVVLLVTVGRRVDGEGGTVVVAAGGVLMGGVVVSGIAGVVSTGRLSAPIQD